MAEVEGYSFRRIRVPVGDREIWIDWDDGPEGGGPVPFTVWAFEGPRDPGRVTCRVVTECDVVGWRRAPDPGAGPAPKGNG